MAEITQDGAFVIQEPRRHGSVAEKFSTIDAVYERLALKCSKLGECHPTSTGVNKEYAKLIILMFKNDIPIPDDLEPPPLPISNINLVEEFGINPVSLSSDDGSRLQAILGPNVRLFDESNGIYLKDEVRAAARRHVSRYLTDDNYRACVDEETAAAEAFNAAATPAPLPTEWGPHLPARAPRLWIDRDKETETDPADFIRQVYGEWLPHLARRDIRYLDQTLYFIYAQSLAATDKASPPVEFGGNPRGRMDDAAYGANAREKSRVATAKFKARKRDCDNSARQPPAVR